MSSLRLASILRLEIVGLLVQPVDDLLLLGDDAGRRADLADRLRAGRRGEKRRGDKQRDDDREASEMVVEIAHEAILALVWWI